jgi:hypothetical protein
VTREVQLNQFSDCEDGHKGRPYIDYGMHLEYARTLTCFGEALLQQNCPEEEPYQQGIAHLVEAFTIFAERYAAIDMERVKRNLPKNLHTYSRT